MEKHFRGSLSIEGDDWQVGVIVGRSGSGKTSIAKKLFSEAYIKGFCYSHKCVLDDFPEGLETGDITKAVSSVGFASPPDWLKAYDCLSQGEKMRENMKSWRVRRVGHVKRSGEDTRINREIRRSVSAKRISLTLEYVPLRVDCGTSKVCLKNGGIIVE